MQSGQSWPGVAHAAFSWKVWSQALASWFVMTPMPLGEQPVGGVLLLRGPFRKGASASPDGQAAEADGQCGAVESGLWGGL